MARPSQVKGRHDPHSGNVQGLDVGTEVWPAGPVQGKPSARHYQGTVVMDQPKPGLIGPPC